MVIIQGMLRVFGKLKSEEGSTAGIFGMRAGRKRRGGGAIKLPSSTRIYNGRKARNQRPELVSQRANKDPVRDNGVLVREVTKNKGGLWPFNPATLEKERSSEMER